MRIPGRKRVKQSARWLRSRFVGRALILGYHRVAQADLDPYSICVTPQHFAEQLEVLRRHGQPLSLVELVHGLQNGCVPKRAVVLTFDDGYADSLYHAKPLLERYQIPASVFVATGYIGRAFWWDELAWILFSMASSLQCSSLRSSGIIEEWSWIGNGPIDLPQESASSRQDLLQSLYRQLRPLATEEREKTLAELRASAGWESEKRPGPEHKRPPSDAERQPHRALTPDELIQLAAGGLVDIGAHTVTHPILSKLPIAVQRSEIRESKACLEELLGRPVSSFSYPNGSSSRETRAIAQSSGFDCACASYSDIAWQGSDPFHLPRFWLPDWDGERFQRWLRTWL